MRGSKGAANHKAKLTEQDVRDIRRSADPQKALARRYGVGVDTIWSIRARKTWRHIDNPSDVPAPSGADEEWRPVPIGKFALLYEVSDCGNLRRRDVRYPRPIRRARASKQGYVVFVLSSGNRQTKVFAHRMVAGAFLPRVPGKPAVNHKDADKANNRASNLEWVTTAENCRHAAENALYPRGERNHASKLTEEAVRAIRASTDTIPALSERWGVSRSAIGRARQRRTWAHL